MKQEYNVEEIGQYNDWGDIYSTISIALLGIIINSIKKRNKDKNGKSKAQIH